MSMKSWAKNEIEIAINNAKKYLADDDYGVEYEKACLKSALKAYKKLCNDNHSGYSFSATKNKLIRLMNGLPLTPITEKDGWNKFTGNIVNEATGEELVLYQSSRMSSLFKHEKLENGKITHVYYSDVDRIICVPIDSDGSCSYHCGFISNLINELFPITFPYYPSGNPYKIFCEEFLTDTRNGDFDTVGVIYGVDPDGNKFNIKRYFKNSNNGWVEISYKTYKKRKENQVTPKHLIKSNEK